MTDSNAVGGASALQTGRLQRQPTDWGCDSNAASGEGRRWGCWVVGLMFPALAAAWLVIMPAPPSTYLTRSVRCHRGMTLEQLTTAMGVRSKRGVSRDTTSAKSKQEKLAEVGGSFGGSGPGLGANARRRTG
jgi:hypothetical protein